MKKWEEERRKKQYQQKISGTKATLKTQPKGVRVNRTPNLQSTGIYEGTSQGLGSQSNYPSRGRADFEQYGQEIYGGEMEAQLYDE